MGLHGDDEEDLAADAVELFGTNETINLDSEVKGLPQGMPAQAQGSESVSTSAASCSGTSRKMRSSTSKAWNDFEEIYKVIDSKERRTGAKCRHCGNSTHGTSHMLRHIPICPVFEWSFCHGSISA